MIEVTEFRTPVGLTTARCEIIALFERFVAEAPDEPHDQEKDLRGRRTVSSRSARDKSFAEAEIRR